MCELSLRPRGRATCSSFQPAELLESPPPFVELLPNAMYVCDAQGRVLWFNGKAAHFWAKPPPGHTADGRNAWASLQETPMARVLRTGEPLHGVEGWVEGPDGTGLLATVDIDPLRDMDGRLIGAINCFHPVPEREGNDRSEGEPPWRALLEMLPAAIYTTDAEGHITYYNRAAVELWGQEPELGNADWCGSWRLFHPDGRPMPHAECPMAEALRQNRPVRGTEAIAERPDGTRVPFIPYPTPLRDTKGRLVGAINMLVDISARKGAETQQAALIDELNHRVKNTLATVQSLATQTLRGSGISREVRAAFEARLLALSRTHNTLAQSHWRSADFKSIVSEVLKPYRHQHGDRIILDGASIELPPRLVLTLAMACQELADNAARHGSLSVPEGTLSVQWEVVREGEGVRLRLRWREAGGPVVAPPGPSGFGRRLIERGIAFELKGAGRLDFDPTGLGCDIEVPVPAAAHE